MVFLYVIRLQNYTTRCEISSEIKIDVLEHRHFVKNWTHKYEIQVECRKRVKRAILNMKSLVFIQVIRIIVIFFLVIIFLGVLPSTR